MFDIFSANPDTFGSVALTGLIREAPTIPTMVGNMNLFRTESVRVKKIMMDVTDDGVFLVPNTVRGGPKTQATRGTRRSLDLEIPRMAQETKVSAAEIAGLRQEGTEDTLMAIAQEVTKRLDQVRLNQAYTEEKHMLNAIQGFSRDAVSDDLIYDYRAEFGAPAAPTITFNMSSPTFELKKTCEQLVIDVKRSARGAWIYGQSRVEAFVGDDFWFALTGHEEVKDWARGWPAMAALKNLDPSDVFEYGGIRFHRYVGSDDNAEIAIGVNDAKFFVSGGRDIFVKALAPADEHMAYVNQLGQSSYVIPKDDSEYASTPRWKGFDLLAYPLFICQRPQTLRNGVAT